VNVAIVGSRSLSVSVEPVMRASVRRLFAVHGTALRIVSGGARGVDALAERIAQEETAHDALVFVAKWEIYGRAAGPLRNEKIVEAADMLVAFWDGASRGTAHSASLARAKGIPTHVYNAATGRWTSDATPAPATTPR
jgi:hypothetical protein